CLLIEIVRAASALVDEIGGERQVPAVAGEAMEFEQGNLDFLMPAIAALLPFARAEGRSNMVDVAQHDVEEAAPAGRLAIGDGALQQVPGAVELMIVAQVGPALVRLAPEIPAIEIAVRRLRPFQAIDDRLNLLLDAGIAPVGEC